MNKDLAQLITTLSPQNQLEWREKLWQAIFILLMENTSKLYEVLYRIDVAEQKVKQAFVDNPTAEIAANRIADLIIERQLQKIAIREKYKPENNN